MDKRNFYIVQLAILALVVIAVILFAPTDSPKFDGDFSSEERQSIIKQIESRSDITPRNLGVDKDNGEYKCSYPGAQCVIRKNTVTDQLEICICSECSSCF